MKPRDIHLGISIEVNFEAEINKIAYVYREKREKSRNKP